MLYLLGLSFTICEMGELDSFPAPPPPRCTIQEVPASWGWGLPLTQQGVSRRRWEEAYLHGSSVLCTAACRPAGAT